MDLWCVCVCVLAFGGMVSISTGCGWVKTPGITAAPGTTQGDKYTRDLAQCQASKGIYLTDEEEEPSVFQEAGVPAVRWSHPSHKSVPSGRLDSRCSPR